MSETDLFKKLPGEILCGNRYSVFNMEKRKGKYRILYKPLLIIKADFTSLEVAIENTILELNKLGYELL